MLPDSTSPEWLQMAMSVIGKFRTPIAAENLTWPDNLLGSYELNCMAWLHNEGFIACDASNVWRLTDEGVVLAKSCEGRTFPRPKLRVPRHKKLHHNGLVMTVPQWAKHLGIGESAIYGRLRRHLPLEEVLCVSPPRRRTRTYREPPKRSKVRYYEYRGEKKTLLELSKISGINKYTLYHRLSNKWTVEEAVTTPVNKSMSCPRNKNWQWLKDRLEKVSK